jgi:hypothetical protein
MRWTDICSNVRQYIGETDTGFFTDEKIMLVGHSIQKQIAERTRCLESSVNITSTTVTTGTTYTLPVDFLEVISMKYDDRPLREMIQKPNVKDYPATDPAAFFMIDEVGTQKFGLYPNSPTAGKTIEVIYKKTTPSYGFRVWHDKSETATLCTVEVKSTGIYFISNGTTGSTATFLFASTGNTTITGIASAIEAHKTPSIGLRCIVADDLVGTRASSILEANYEALDIYGLDKQKFLFPSIELPKEAHYLLIQGIVEALKFKDREYNAANYKNSVYFEQLKMFERKYKLRKQSVNFYNIHRGKNCGNAPYRDETMEIFIP